MDGANTPAARQDPTGPEIDGNQPNEPAEGPRDHNDRAKGDTTKIDSTHTPDTRSFDL